VTRCQVAAATGPETRTQRPPGTKPRFRLSALDSGGAAITHDEQPRPLDLIERHPVHTWAAGLVRPRFDRVPLEPVEIALIEACDFEPGRQGRRQILAIRLEDDRFRVR